MTLRVVEGSGQPVVNEGLVTKLEQLLEDARAGRFLTMVAVMIGPAQNRFMSDVHEGTQTVEVLGMLALLRHDLEREAMARLTTRRDPDPGH